MCSLRATSASAATASITPTKISTTPVICAQLTFEIHSRNRNKNDFLRFPIQMSHLLSASCVPPPVTCPPPGKKFARLCEAPGLRGVGPRFDFFAKQQSKVKPALAPLPNLHTEDAPQI